MRRSALSKIQLSLLAFGLIGGGLIACGDDPAPAPTQQGDGDTGDGDKGDGDKGDGDGDGDGDNVRETECMAYTGGIRGRGCKLEGGGQGIQLCDEDDKPTGKCKKPQDLIGDFLGDSGLADASIDLPEDAGVADCPSSMMCEKLGGALGDALVGFVMQAKAFRDGLGTICETGGMPPACTKASDCTSMGLTAASCVANPASGLIGAAMICVQKCEP